MAVLPVQRVFQALPWPLFCVSDTFVAEPMSPEAECSVSCVMMMFLGQMRSEPHLFQVSVDSPQAKNKPLKYFHCVSLLPSATDLRCSNDFKRKKTVSEFDYRVCMHTDVPV